MKKIIILAIATLSTGIVLSSNMKKNEVVVVKAMPSVSAKKSISNNADKNADKPSYDVLATAD